MKTMCLSGLFTTACFLTFVQKGFQTSISSCRTEKHEIRAQEYFDQGELLWHEDHLNDSIPFYRAAVRLCPKNISYWTKLGQAELKMGDGEKASRRLQLVSLLKGEEGREKASVLKDDRKDNTDDSIRSLTQQTSTPILAQIKEISKLSNFRHSFLVRNIIAQNEAFGGATTILSHLLSHFPEERVEFYPQNMITKPSRVYKVSLSEAVEYLDFPDGAYVSSDCSEEGTYIQFPLSQTIFQQLLGTYNSSLISTLFPSNIHILFDKSLAMEELEAFYSMTHWFMMLIGEDNAGMFNHTDQLPVGSWQLQLTGKKQWTICSPEPAGECARSLLQPLDLIYYPPYHYHETRCIEGPCISLSSTVLPRSHFQLMREFLHGECSSGNLGYRFSASFCQKIQAYGNEL